MGLAEDLFRALRMSPDEYDVWAADLEAEMKARQRQRALDAHRRRQRENRVTDSQR